MTTYFVDTRAINASDSNTGTSLTSPFKTISRANNVVVSGDTVSVRPGTYAESTSLKTDNVAWLGENGAFVDVTGLGNGFTIPSLNNVTVQGFKVANTSTGYGIAIQGGGGHKVLYNKVTNCTSGGIRLQPTSGLMGACIIEGNEVYANGSHGIYLFTANAVQVRGNNCHHNALHGIALINDSNDNVVEFNRSYNNSNGTRTANGIQCDNFGTGTPGSKRNLIQHNILFRNDDSGLSIYNGSDDCIVRRNISYLNGDHGFDNSSANNCHFIGNTAYGNVTAGFNSEGTSTNTRMYNNIAMDNGVASPRTSGNYRCDPSANATALVDYNLSYLTVPAASQPVVGGQTNAEMVWGNTNYQTLAAFKTAVPSQMVNGLAGDPLFASIARSDYRTSPGSPARNAGYNGAVDHQARDFSGNLSGTTPDCGAFQN